MKRFLITAASIVAGFGMVTVVFPDGAAAILVVIFASLAALAIFRRFSDDKEFITNVFLGALLARIVFGILVHIFELREFFGGDAKAYDENGWLIASYWLGQIKFLDVGLQSALSTSAPGWGMNYLVGLIYVAVGHNIFAAQCLCAVIGAATAPMAYFCAKRIFHNESVAKLSAIAVALFPAFIIWSGQLLKDGLIVFLLVLAMTMVLQLQHKFSYAAVLLLIFCLFGILSLRFYIFYMVAIAVAGSFLIGINNSVQSIVRRMAVIVLIGIGLTYIGVERTANVEFERFGNLEAVQNSRLDLAQTGASGFGRDVDVSTTEGAISAIPLGFAYLMFAPFPWQVSNFRQAITLPEVLLWWGMIPLMLYGLWYTIRNRLRTAFPVVIFSLMLTLAYSIFQGNVGTAYRQRTQIQVFLFMFIAVGWTLIKERRENKLLINRARRSHMEQGMQARLL